jgi:hypothetical protein
MPGFGINANLELGPPVPQLGAGGMYTPEEVWAIMMYERNLSAMEADAVQPGADPSAVATSVDSPARAATTTTRPTTTTTEETE